MDEHKDIIEEKLCKEIESIKDKLRGGGDINETDAKKLDLFYHILKSKVGYETTKQEKEMYGMGGMSYENRRGYSGAYSMDMGPGNSGRYGRSMAQGYSGHYPMMPEPYYYEGRQW